MAKQTRDTLKSFFQTGDVPTEGQYADLIDSNLNLSENNTGDILLTGNISASNFISASRFITDGEITASGNISSSGNLNANQISGSQISSSGNLSCQDARVLGSLGLTTTNITASGNISSSGNIIAANAIITDITSSNISSSGIINADRFQANSTTVIVDDGVTTFFGAANKTEIDGTNIKLDAPVTASIISSSGTLHTNDLIISGTTVTATANELNKLDGATVTTTEINHLDGVSATNATHLKTMNQSVSTAAAVNFASLHLSNPATALTVENNVPQEVEFANGGTIEGRKMVIRLSGVPQIRARAEDRFNYQVTGTISNADLNVGDVVFCTARDIDLTCEIIKFTGNTFQIALGNMSLSAHSNTTASVNVIAI